MRIPDLVAHHGREFQSHQTEANHAVRIKDKLGIGWNSELCRRDRGPEARPDRQSQPDENRCRDKRSHAANVVQPLTNA